MIRQAEGTPSTTERLSFLQRLRQQADELLPYVFSFVGIFLLMPSEAVGERIVLAAVGGFLAVGLLHVGYAVALALVNHVVKRDVDYAALRGPTSAAAFLLAVVTFGMGRSYALQDNEQIANEIVSCVEGVRREGSLIDTTQIEPAHIAYQVHSVIEWCSKRHELGAD